MFALALAISNLPLLEAALITWSPYKVTPYATARPQVLSYATPLQIAKVRKCSGWQELNLRGHVPKTCGWPLPYTRIWWLGTELNRIHWLFRPALCRRVPEPNFGGRCEN